MKSQREIERDYNKLLYEVNTDEYYTKTDLTNRVNCYKCNCGHITKTKDIDSGVTPFMFKCEKCGNYAHSTFYNDIVPKQEPTFIWYRPTLKEVIKMRKKPELLDHILNGGLDYKPIN